MLVRKLLSLAILSCWVFFSRSVLGQSPEAGDSARWLIGDRSWQYSDGSGPNAAAASALWLVGASRVPALGNQPRTPRFQLFGMPAAFLCDPLGLDSGHDPTLADETATPWGGADDDLGEGLRVALGEDNLYFDPRRRGTPGGAGFWKVQSLLQLVDLEATSLCLGMQAVMPAGPETGGADSGPTVLSPTLAWFHDLGEGAAVHGFVGQQIQANSRWRNHLGADVQCGMAVQYPLLGLEDTNAQGLYLFLQALGRLNDEADLTRGKRPAWEVVPGIYWRMNERCWLSMGGSRLSLITCSWKY